uniref:C2H2-type domain-containing protein n=1 Tax=Timema bartmani TaxID=61472 RepID=A0A7R9HWC7_9NEOP|nr:unnamed protein product [Timema bartmani]
MSGNKTTTVQVCWFTTRYTPEQSENKCKDCGKSFPHQEGAHLPLPHQQGTGGVQRCIECGKFYSTKSVLILHYNIHSLYLRYKCTECHEYFLSKNDLSVHSHRTDAIQVRGM